MTFLFRLVRLFSVRVCSARPLADRIAAARANTEHGMTTAEYAVGTVAAVAFAAVLYKVVRSEAVASALGSVIQSALHAI